MGRVVTGAIVVVTTSARIRICSGAMLLSLVSRELWTCPTCGRRFVGWNMWHACGDYSVEKFIARPWCAARQRWVEPRVHEVRIAVLGAGGVGGYFGGRLAQSGEDVQFVARGEHLRAIRRHGLRVRSVRGDFEVSAFATDDPKEVGPCEFVLFCLKSFDTREAAAALDPLLAPNTAIVSLQNGVDNEEAIATQIGWDRVLGGVAFIFSMVPEPGVVEDTGGPARVVFGEWDGQPSERGTRLLEAFHRAGVDAELSSNIRSVLWNKFAFICAQAGMTAATQLPIGEIRSVPEAGEMFRQLVEEVCAVAAAEGVDLGPDAVDHHVRFAEGLEPDGRSSLYNDMVQGKRMELEALHGTVVRLAERHRVPVPASRAIYRLLKAWAVRNERGEGPASRG
jgi:2-dehydropantoate 2-reductase